MASAPLQGSRRGGLRDHPLARGGAADFLMPGMLLLVGMPALLAALWLAGDELLFRRGAPYVMGSVVERSGGAPSLTLEFETLQGGRHRIETFGSDLHADHAVGSRIGVFVNAAQPDNSRPDLFTTGWMIPLILGVFGAFFALPGIAFLLGALRSPLRRQHAGRQTWPVQGRVIEVRPVLTIEGMRNRAGKGDLELSLRQEDGADGEPGPWRLTVNGQEQDPFSPDAADWGVQYAIAAEWTDPQTGKSHYAESEPFDADPRPVLAFGTVTVLVDPDDPQNCSVQSPWAGIAA